MEDEYRGMFKYEHLHNMCFNCGFLGHSRRDCRHQQPEVIADKLWYESWMQAETVARTSIVWAMTKEGFLQEEEEASMLNILLDQDPGASERVSGPAGEQKDYVGVSHGDTCVVTEGTTQVSAEPFVFSNVCVGGHGGCFNTIHQILCTRLWIG